MIPTADAHHRSRLSLKLLANLIQTGGFHTPSLDLINLLELLTEPRGTFIYIYQFIKRIFWRKQMNNQMNRCTRQDPEASQVQELLCPQNRGAPSPQPVHIFTSPETHQILFSRVFIELNLQHFPSPPQRLVVGAGSFNSNHMGDQPHPKATQEYHPKSPHQHKLKRGSSGRTKDTLSLRKFLKGLPWSSSV